MMKSVFIVAFLCTTSIVFCKGDINYNHKLVEKTLTKSCNLNNPELKELRVPDIIEEETTLMGKFFTIESENTDSNIAHVYIGRVNSCRAGGCSIPNTTPFGASEYFDYMVCYNNKGEVSLVKVFNYQATHGYEVTAKGWLKQFIGYTTEKELEVGKNIDSISGATISVNGITEDIADKTAILNRILNHS